MIPLELQRAGGFIASLVDDGTRIGDGSTLERVGNVTRVRGSTGTSQQGGHGDGQREHRLHVEREREYGETGKVEERADRTKLSADADDMECPTAIRRRT